MSTIRPARRRRYTSISREAINDERLSYRARGILAWLLDKPDDWRADSGQMAGAGKEGRDAIRTALRELTECGYLVRSKAQGADGRWATETVIYESPQDAPPKTESQASVTEKPSSDDQPSDDQPSESQALYQGLSLKTVTEAHSVRASHPDATNVTKIQPGSDNDPLFAAFWAAYPRKQGKGGGGGARGAWRGAIKKAAPDVIVEAAVRFANDPNLPREDTFVPLPATWLNQERWQDGPLPQRADGRGHGAGPSVDEAWALVLAAIRAHGRTQSPTFADRITAKVVGQIGWRNICMSDNLNVTKGQFARLYEAAGRPGDAPDEAVGGGA